MKNLRTMFLTLFLFVSHAKPYSPKEEPCCAKRDAACSLQFRTSYFRPSSEIVRNVYDNGILDLAFEATKEVYDSHEVWGAINWASKNGCSLCFQEKSPTKLSFISLSIGIKHVFSLTKYMNCYLGIGPCYTLMHIHDKYPYVQQRVFDNNSGLLLKAGLRFETSHLLLDIFTDYMVQKFKLTCCLAAGNIQHRNLNLSGLRAGAGIGFTF